MATVLPLFGVEHCLLLLGFYYWVSLSSTEPLLLLAVVPMPDVCLCDSQRGLVCSTGLLFSHSAVMSGTVTVTFISIALEVNPSVASAIKDVRDSCSFPVHSLSVAQACAVYVPTPYFVCHMVSCLQQQTPQ